MKTTKDCFLQEQEKFPNVAFTSAALLLELGIVAGEYSSPTGLDEVSNNFTNQHSELGVIQENTDKITHVDKTLGTAIFWGDMEPETNFAQLEETTINNTASNATNSSLAIEEKVNMTSIVACSDGKENSGLPVELVNSTRLISILVTESNVTDRRTAADCTLVLFYARYCPFSSMAAPHFNALSRAFPDIKLAAVDAMKHHSFNTQYGIVGVPTLLLFHNGRPAAKFNDSEYNLEAFARFITKYTGLQSHDKLYVTSADFGGPVSSVPTKETDYCLILSWAFILICGLYLFSKSSWWRWISEAIQNTWQEAEAQHEHGD